MVSGYPGERLLQSQNPPLGMTTRDKYIEIATTLTKPLIDSYYLKLTATIKAKPSRIMEEETTSPTGSLPD
jgi:hypothetical protein